MPRKKLPSLAAREPSLRPHIFNLVGFAAEPLWCVQITRKRIAPKTSRLAGEMSCYVVCAHANPTAPLDRRRVRACDLRHKNLLTAPPWVIDTFVRHGALTRSEARTLRAQLRAIETEAHRRRNVTVCKPTRAHGFEPYANIGKGRLTSEHLRQIG